MTRAVWLKQNRFPLLLLAAGLAVTAVLTLSLRQQERENSRFYLHSDTEAYGIYLGRAAERSIALLTTMQQVFERQDVTAETFLPIADHALLHYPQLKSILWVERVDASERHAVETRERARLPDFEITALRDGKQQLAADVDVLYPVIFQPNPRREQNVIGLDLGSLPLASALDAVRDQGPGHYAVEMAPGLGATLSGERNPEHFLVVILPVYEGEPLSLETRRRQLKGFLMGAVRIVNLLDDFVASERQRHLDLAVLDVSAADRTIVVALTDEEAGSARGSDDAEDYVYDFSVAGGRHWQVIASPDAHYLAYVDTGLWRHLLLTGAVFSLLVFGYTYSINNRSRAVEVMVKRRTAELEKANDLLIQKSFTDSLTGVGNRRLFDETIEKEWQRASRYGTPLSIMMIDIDHFKGYNDCYGHLAGDKCLQAVALALRGCFWRPGDLFARYGGEEFVAVMPNTDLSVASNSHRCLDAVRELAIPHQASPISEFVTVSIGYCTVYPSPQYSLRQFMAVADTALYEAKVAGRNRAVFNTVLAETSGL